ncbi:glycosyltransferase [Microbacterium sp. HJ5]
MRVRIARLIPDRLLERLLPAQLQFTAGVAPARPADPAMPIRLFIGPVNFAGQGWQWARAAERFLDGVSATSMAYSAGSMYRFPVDQRVSASVYLMSRPWQDRQRAAVTTGYTHVIVEAGRSLFGDVYRQSVADQVRMLQSTGIRVALLTHGSDMRIPSRHATAHEFSPYAPGEWELTDTLRDEADRNHRLAADLAVPVFVSTPGMLDDVPYGLWLPVVVDPALWVTDTPPLASAVPLVVHAPSSTAVKGTNLIEPTLARLVDDGLIRYERIEGIAADAIPDRFRSADIVLDQFRLGDYGVAACEAMAAGRVVVGNVTPGIRRRVREQTNCELPIVQADPNTLETVLRGMVADPQRARATAAAGPAFVAEVHDGRRSAQVLAPFLHSDDSGASLSEG